jgi:hypothetical protein
LASTAETFNEFPKEPGYLAANSPRPYPPDDLVFKKSSRFLIITAVAFEFAIAFFAAESFTTRTSFKLLPYAKKFAAVKNDVKFPSSGAPKIFTKLFSESTVITSPTGPHFKTPANAPAEVATEGTIAVNPFLVLVRQVRAEMPSYSP